MTFLTRQNPVILNLFYRVKEKFEKSRLIIRRELREVVKKMRSVSYRPDWTSLTRQNPAILTMFIELRRRLKSYGRLKEGE